MQNLFHQGLCYCVFGNKGSHYNVILLTALRFYPLLFFPPPPFGSSIGCTSPLPPPLVFPAIQAAISKFCRGFPADAPPESILFFCCSSNSARISGSTVQAPKSQHITLFSASATSLRFSIEVGTYCYPTSKASQSRYPTPQPQSES